MEDVFIKNGFDLNEEYQDLKKYQNFLFFLDGYDELVTNSFINIFDKNNLTEWKNSRFFIITRSY